MLWPVFCFALCALLGAVLSFDKELPKIELHSHLHGSIRLETLLDLNAKAGSEAKVPELGAQSDPFDIFKAIHILVGILP
jgi:adenosine deaminase